MQQEILTRLDALAAKLGVAAEHIYAVYVAQANIEAITRLVGLVVILLVAPIVFRLRKRLPEDWTDEPHYIIPVICGGAALLGIIIGVAIHVVEIPTLLYNPEFWALKQIGKMLTGGK